MNDNLFKYEKVFRDSFGDNISDIANLTYQAIPEWDSIGHMTMISLLEDEFEIMMETEDIIDFSSYAKGIEILKKYNVEF
jgi:acyl carrier protein